MLTWLTSSKTVPLDEQLARFAENGIRLRPGVTVRDVKSVLSHLKLESAGYPATLSALGAELRDGNGRSSFLSDDAWFFDAACVSVPGDYAFVVTRLAQILPVEFPARDAGDSIDIANWRASVSFELGDARLHWTQRVMNQFVDETLFVRINQLIDESNPGMDGSMHVGTRHLWQVPLSGRQRLLVAATTAHGRRLAQVSGLALRTIV